MLQGVDNISACNHFNHTQTGLGPLVYVPQLPAQGFNFEIQHANIISKNKKDKENHMASDRIILWTNKVFYHCEVGHTSVNKMIPLPCLYIGNRTVVQVSGLVELQTQS